MSIQISDHFTYGRLLRFSMPSIIMMIFTSLYTVVDGLFVSNLAGQQAFASLNLVWPAIGLLQAFGFMIGAGGCALVSKTLGEGQQRRACEYFSMLVVFEILLGLVVSTITIVLIEPICRMLGATEYLMEDCIIYGVPLLAVQCFFYLHTSLQSFFITAGKPKLGLAITLVTGFSNMFLDWLLIAGFGMGILGAALATAINWVASALVSAWWFWKHQESPVHLCHFSWHCKALVQACVNGSSEMVTNCSASFVLMLYNLSLMALAGPDGVISYGIIQYILFLFSSTFFGFTMAVAPCIGYQYGAANHVELKNLLVKSLIITTLASLVLTGIAELSAPALAHVFVSYSQSLMDLTVHAIRIFSIGFLMSGLCIFISGFFTALNNGLVSALLSFARTFLFQTGCILILPRLAGVEGIWAASPTAETLSLVVSLLFLIALRRKYQY